MTALTNWFIRNPVAANLLMLLILLGGAFTLSSMRIEGFPKLPADTITIQTEYPDAYTEQVDEHITQKIEEALEGLQGVKAVRSTSLESLSLVRVVKIDGYNLQRLLNDVRLRLDTVSQLPREAEKPVINRNEFDFPVLYVQLYGTADTDALQSLFRRLKEQVLALPEVSRVNTWGLKKPEVRIEVQPFALQKYDLTVEMIAGAIAQSSLLFKAGELKTQDGTLSIRADSQAYYRDDFADITVYERSDGARIRLADVATVIDDFEDDDVVVRFTGQPAIGMEVLIGRKENLLEIANAVKVATAEFSQQLPAGVSLSVWGDASHYIDERLQLLKTNALQGLALVLVLLALFLNVKLAFWVAMGVPISVAGAIAVMGTGWIDYSLNDVTTFGLIIALGILVDDAVVVGESVFEQRKLNADPIHATEKGVKVVAAATIFGVLTTVAAFYPMLLIDNALGKVLASFAGVLILALLFSLLESKFILPAHLAHISLSESVNPNGVQRVWSRFQRGAQQGLRAVRDDYYQPLLRWSLHNRYACIVVFVALGLFGLGLMGLGKIHTVFFPDVPGQIITVNLEMDARAPYRKLLDYTQKLEAEAQQLNLHYTDQFDLSAVPIQHVLVVADGVSSAELYAELSPVADRKQSGLGTFDIMQAWQQRVGELEGVTKLTFTGAEDVGGGFEIKLLSKNLHSLQQASENLKTSLMGMQGINNVRDSLKHGRPEIFLQLKPQARHLGFSEADLAIQIGQCFGGAEVQRLQRDRQEVKVIAQNAASARASQEDLFSTRLRSPQGHWLPLSAVASVHFRYAAETIARDNGRRVNSIEAFIDKRVVSPNEVMQQLHATTFSDIKQLFPDVAIQLGGELEQEGEIKQGLVNALIFTAVLIYALLAVPLKSYWQPLVIMSVVPFGLVGAALGHWWMDLPFSLLSFFGMLALTGVVVNDSLVMMTRYNQAREEGEPPQLALMTAGVGRFQAIILTTATTVAGLIPLLSETSEQAQYLIPAAVSLAFGELFATAITLVLVPVLIAIGNDCYHVFKPRKESHDVLAKS